MKSQERTIKSIKVILKWTIKLHEKKKRATNFKPFVTLHYVIALRHAKTFLKTLNFNVSNDLIDVN